MTPDEAIEQIGLCPNEAGRVLLAEVERLRAELAESETAGLRQKIDRLCQDYVDQDKKRDGEVKELNRVIYQLKEKLRLSEEERDNLKQQLAECDTECTRLQAGLDNQETKP